VRRLVALVALFAAALLAPALASAHPLGNFTINHYARAELSGGGLYLRYVLDMAEIPTFRERDRVDAAGGLGPYAAARARALAPDLVLSVDGRPVPVDPVSSVASYHPGQAGLSTLRFAAWYRVPAAGRVAGGRHRVSLRDQTYAGRLGWKEVVVHASSGAQVAGANVPATDTSDELRHYPKDLLSRPLDVQEADFGWSPGSGPGAVGPLTRDPESRVVDSKPGGLGGLVDGRLTVGVVIIALLLAMGWGALHSLSPGHGKSMVAAYLVGTRGTARHAVLLGVFVTVTHTIGVVLLGLVALFASRYILPETLFPWLNLTAALLVVGIGLLVLWRRFKRVRGDRRHARAHPEGGSHHHPPHEHRHAPPAPAPVLVGAGVGAVAGPLGAAMLHEEPHGHHHHHEHDHHHHHGGHDHDHHHHGPGGHSHTPPDDLSLRNLVAVGLSAGIIPCPSAMVLLLGAISLHRIGYGLVLVLAFSVGLAGVLTVIGLLVLYARRLVERLPLGGRVAAAMPVASALVIVGLGVVLMTRAIPTLL
jgi:ABC-type nickel/cobalt efflux system permease component RcnA